MKRTLSLKREALADLSTEDLSGIAGAEYRDVTTGSPCRVGAEFVAALTDALTRLTCDYRWCFTFPYC